LRVPLYQKIFEAFFFITFLGLYYAVLVERNPHRISVFEILLCVWVAGFGYRELGEFQDAGTLFYIVDFWNLWDICILLTGVAFVIIRESRPHP
jgi:hypothetical protein